MSRITLTKQCLPSHSRIGLERVRIEPRVLRKAQIGREGTCQAARFGTRLANLHRVDKLPSDDDTGKADSQL